MLVFLPLLAQANGLNQDIKTKKEELAHVSRVNSQLLLDVVNAQLKALRENQLERAYQEFTSMQFKENTSLEAFKELVAKFKALSHNKLFQFQSFYLEDNIATFGGDLQSMEGQSIPVEYDFVLEDGKWKILGIQIYQTEVSLIPP